MNTISDTTGARSQAIDPEREGGACLYRGDAAAEKQDPLEHSIDEPSPPKTVQRIWSKNDLKPHRE